MNLNIEAALYFIQIAAVFGLALPTVFQAERKRSLSRNPAWVISHPEFRKDKGKVPVWPVWIAGIVLALLLGLAIWNQNLKLLFIVHGPLFLACLLALLLAFRQMEGGIRSQIPETHIQRAHLMPRSFSRYVSPRITWLLGVVLFCGVGINGVGYAAHAITRVRALGNLSFLGIFMAAAIYGCIWTVQRKPIQTSFDTDEMGRNFELQLISAGGFFFAGLGLLFSVGSIGMHPWFPLPPTLLHAWIESVPISWNNFFKDAQYRGVDYGASLSLILLSIWIFAHPFYRKILAVNFEEGIHPHQI